MSSPAKANSAATPAPPPYSGAGGKFRKKPVKRSQTTPYDRPAMALRPTAVAGANDNKGWLSKIVDPASKIITAGAHRLFSSVFRKRLLPPPSHSPPVKEQQQQRSGSDEMNETADVRPGPTTNAVAPATKDSVIPGGDDKFGAPDCNGVAELERILKQKSFTRSEIDRLTELLISRAVENSVGSEQGRSDPIFVDTPVVTARHEKLPNPPAYENRTEHAIAAAISTPGVRTKVLKDDVASPAEIAKAYMGSRPKNVSCLNLDLRNHRSKEVVPASHNPVPTPRSSSLSLVQKSVSDIGNSSNGFMTPRLRGRSAIYNMARTPYSRVHPSQILKAAETDVNDSIRSSPYHNSAENSRSKRQALKRRSTIMENDIGSVGPIRRIRQKPNLLHPKTLSLPPSNRQAIHLSGVLADAAEVPSSMEWTSQNHSLSKAVEENNMPSTSGEGVPSQSVEMAQKIFEQLDKFVPTGKSPEKKFAVSIEDSPSKSTFPLLNGSVHKSKGTVDSLKSLGSTQDGKKGDSVLHSVLANNQPPMMPSAVGDISRKNSSISSSTLALQNGADPRYTGSSKTPEHEPLSSFDRPQKKRGFQMSALEDFADVDDDVPSAEVVTSTTLTDGRGRAELSIKSAATPNGLSREKTLALEKPAGPELEPSTSSPFVKERVSLANGSAACESTSSLSFSVTPSSTSKAMPEAVSIFQSMPKSDKVASENHNSNIFPTFGTNSDKSPPSSFYVPPSAVDATPKDDKLQAPDSAFDTAAKANIPDKIDNKSKQVVGDSTLKSGDVAATSSANLTFPAVSQTNNATPSNGFPSTVPGTSGASFLLKCQANSSNQGSGSALVFNGSAEPTSGSSTAAGIFVSIATSNSMSALSDSGCYPNNSVAAPLFSKSQIQSDSSAVSSTSTSATPATEFTANSGAKPGDTVLSSATASLASVKPSPFPMNGNSIFGFSASTANSSTSEAQTSAAPARSGSQFSFQAPSSGTSFSTQAPSFLGQSSSSVSAPTFTSTLNFAGSSGASASTSVFGSTPASSFSSSAPIFGSSPASPFSSVSGSSISALGSSSMSLSVSTSNTTPSLFGASWQPSKPIASGLSFTAASPSTAFSFGSTPSASGSSAATSNTTAFGATTNSSAAATSFVFGGTTRSSASSNSLPFVFGSTSGAAPSVFSTSAASTPATSMSLFQSQPAFGNASPSPFGFGSNLSGNNDQMTMEDSMAEDSMQPSIPAVQTLGAPPSAPISTGNPFPFTSQQNQLGGPPSSGNPFLFNNQTNQFAPQNSSQFQPSGSGEFNLGGGGGSFSVGSSDKSQRKMIRAKRTGTLRRK